MVTYKVRAIRSDNSVVSYSGYCTAVTVSVLPPEAPTNVSAYSTSSSKVKLNWTAAEGVDGYEIRRSSSKDSGYEKLTTTSGTSKEVSASSKKLNYYKIRSYTNQNGKKTYSGYTDPVAIYPLSKPSELSVSVTSAGAITLKWKSVSNAQRYDVYYSRTEDGTYTKKTSTTEPQATLTGLLSSSNSSVYLKVYAARTDGSVSSRSGYSAAVKASLPPKAPTGLSAYSTSSDKVKLSWSAVTNAEGYEIYRSSSMGSGYSKSTSTTGLSKSVSASSKKVNYYKVRAYVTMNGKKLYGDYSQPFAIYPLSKPSSLKGAAYSGSNTSSDIRSGELPRPRRGTDSLGVISTRE